MENVIQTFALSDWKDLSIVIQGILMIFLVGAAAYQFRALRTENKKSRTHEICDRYTCDPIVHGATRIMRASWLNEDIFKNSEKYRTDIITILNYFENVAIGINRKIYDEDLVFDYLGSAMRINTKRFLNEDFLRIINFMTTKKSYIVLQALSKKWDKRHDASVIPASLIEVPKNYRKAA